MTDTQLAPAEELQAEPPHKNRLIVPSWMVMTIAAIAIGAWVGFSGFMLANDASEAERASIQKTAEAFAMMAFGYFLGSAAGSRNKEHGK